MKRMILLAPTARRTRMADYTRHPLALSPRRSQLCRVMQGRMKILYFAWLREKIGRSVEQPSLPAGIATVQQLIDWLKLQSPGHAAAFANQSAIRCALDQEFAGRDALIDGVREAAFFPPMTGG